MKKLRKIFSFIVVFVLVLNSFVLSSYAASIKYTESQFKTIEQHFDQHPYVLKRHFWANTTSTGRTITRDLQNLYNALGYKVSVDNQWGPEMEKTTKEIQRKLGLSADGMVGNDTFNALMKYSRKKLLNSNNSSNNTTNISSSIPSSVRIKQNTSYTCTLASATMLIRAKLYTQGKSYSSVTESKVKPYAWTNSGLLNSFVYNNIKVKSCSLTGTTSQKKKKIQKLFKDHPEGLVLYGWNNSRSHAVYISPNMMVLDPAPNAKNSFISISDSYLPDESLSSVKKIWYID